LIVSLVAAVAFSMLAASFSAAAPQKKDLLDELGLPKLAGAKPIDELNIQPGKLLANLAKDIEGLFGIEELKQLNVLTLAIDKSSEEVFRFYDPAFAEQKWATIARSLDKDGEGTTLMFNEKKGLLLMLVTGDKADNREMTAIRMQGKIDPSKFGSNDKEISEDLKKFIGEFTDSETSNFQGKANIPAGRPISIPPAAKLVSKATNSDINATVLDQNTAEIRLANRKGDLEAGELVRVDDMLVLALTPKLPVEEIDIPGAVPVAFDLTDGSLRLTTGPKPADRPIRLSVISTGAAVNLDDFPLISGTHMVKILGAELNMTFSRVQGGEFVISATGDDVTISLPKDASVKVDVDVSDGKIEKLIAGDLQKDDPDHIVFQLGAGKARIAVHAVKGNVCIKPAE
jgi:hypothetical protein